MKVAAVVLAAAVLVGANVAPVAADEGEGPCMEGVGCPTMSVEQATAMARRYLCPVLRAEARVERYAVEGHRLSRKARAALARTQGALEDMSAEFAGGWTSQGLWPSGEVADDTAALATMAEDDANWLDENVTRRYVWDGYELFDLSEDVAQVWADLGAQAPC